MAKPERCCGDAGGVEEGLLFHIPQYSPGRNLLCSQQHISISLMTKMCCLYYLIVEKLDESVTQTPNS